MKRLLGDFAQRMSPEVLELYVFIHYNWQYEWMRPTIDEIVEAYTKMYGNDAREEDVFPDQNSDSDTEDEGDSEPAPTHS